MHKIKNLSTYKYDIILPDDSILSTNLSIKDIGEIICYKNKGFPKLDLYEISDIDNQEEENMIENTIIRGNLYLIVKSNFK